METGLVLLSQAFLPLSYWCCAFQTAIFLINKQTSSVLDYNCPYQTLFNEIPNYKMLKTFGCACYPCLKPYNQHKLEFHTQKYVFMGYSFSHKGNKCLSGSGKVYVFASVRFDEADFPFKLNPKFGEKYARESVIVLLDTNSTLSMFLPQDQFKRVDIVPEKNSKNTKQGSISLNKIQQPLDNVLPNSLTNPHANTSIDSTIPTISQSQSISNSQENWCVNKSSIVLQPPDTIDSKDTYATIQLELQFPSLSESMTGSSKELSANVEENKSDLALV